MKIHAVHYMSVCMCVCVWCRACGVWEVLVCLQCACVSPCVCLCMCVFLYMRLLVSLCVVFLYCVYVSLCMRCLCMCVSLSANVRMLCLYVHVSHPKCLCISPCVWRGCVVMSVFMVCDIGYAWCFVVSGYMHVFMVLSIYTCIKTFIVINHSLPNVLHYLKPILAKI